MPANTAQLRAFFQTLQGENAKPLPYGHRYYIPRFASDPSKDPILGLKTRIVFSDADSVHLLTGYRGNGKSTELNRLAALLEKEGCTVFLVDMLGFLITSKPLELSDFLLSLMAGLSKAVEGQSTLQPAREGYWARLRNVLATRVEVDSLKLEGGAGDITASIGARLQRDPTFKEQIQVHLRGHLTQLVRDAQTFVAEVVGAVREEAGDPGRPVVLLVDSVEQLRGFGEDASRVQNSLVELFSGQAANLRFPLLHVVYTVPPFLSTLAPGFGGLVSGNPLVVWPNVHVRDRSGAPDRDGIDLMVRIIEARSERWRSFFDEDAMRRLAAFSGGDVRDFFRLVRECLVTLNTGGKDRVDTAVLDRVEGQLRSEHTPIAADDARWLARVAREKSTALESTEDAARLARFLDTNLIMNYLNGEPWYDVHPALCDEIRKVAGPVAP
jgi:hypothetical protein